MKIVELIVNADDLGATPAVNDAVFDLIDRKLVTSATIIANGPHVEEACQQVNRYPHCSFGVHLNITEFSPLSGPSMVGALLSPHGDFAPQRIRNTSIDSTLSEGIYEEFCAQIQRLLSLGVRIGHIDSHEHVHTIPRVFPILKKVQRRFNIRKVRISRNIYGLEEDVPWSLKFKKKVYNSVLRHYYRTTTTQGFGDFECFYENARSQRLKHKRVEVMVHPGSHLYGNDEIELLKGSWRESLDIPVRLISYYDFG